MITRIFINSISLLLGAWLLPGIHIQESFWTVVIAAIVLGLLNTFIKPLLILFTLPITIFTLGIFLLFINAIIIEIADFLLDGFVVESFLWAFLLSLIISITNSILEGSKKETERRES